MNKNQFPEIKTDRIILRKLKVTDWKIISYLRSDKEVNKFVKRPEAPTKEKALEFIATISNNIIKYKTFYWAIATTGNDQMIGSICLWNFSNDRKTAEVGYDLSPKFQGKGLMNESLKSVLDFGFNTLNLDLIEAYTHRENTKSIHLLKKNNFKLVVGKKDNDNLENSIFEIGKEAFI